GPDEPADVLVGKRIEIAMRQEGHDGQEPLVVERTEHGCPDDVDDDHEGDEGHQDRRKIEERLAPAMATSLARFRIHVVAQFQPPLSPLARPSAYGNERCANQGSIFPGTVEAADKKTPSGRGLRTARSRTWRSDRRVSAEGPPFLI